MNSNTECYSNLREEMVTENKVIALDKMSFLRTKVGRKK